jgi:alpha-tubulin suppressor-like RCC1 family protein
MVSWANSATLTTYVQTGGANARWPLPLFVLSAVAFGCAESKEVLTRTVNNLSDAASPQPAEEPEVDASTQAASSSDGSSDAVPDAGSQHRPDDYDRPDVVVGTSYHSTCASVFGKFYCWGENTHGQLGLDPDRAVERPIRLNVDFVATVIDGGERHMCAVDTNATVHCWGANDAGQLGQNDAGDRFEPAAVQLPEKVYALSCGADHVCVIGASGQLYCWGRNDDGQTALVVDTDKAADAGKEVRNPTLVDPGPWLTISAGEKHTCGTKTDKSLWCWGRNTDRQVGQHEGERFTTPKQVGQNHDWVMAVAGQTHSCGLKNDRSLWCWGSNINGENYPLGSSWSDKEEDPTYVSGIQWQSVHSRGLSSCGLTLEGEALCWGRNAEGQLGLDDFELRESPVFIARGGLQLSTGLLHTCGVSVDLDVYCTGSNKVGQLGIGTFDGRNQFTLVRF